MFLLRVLTSSSPPFHFSNHQVADGSKEGRASRLSLWSHPGSDVTGMVARSQKVAGNMSRGKVKKKSMNYASL